MRSLEGPFLTCIMLCPAHLIKTLAYCVFISAGGSIIGGYFDPARINTTSDWLVSQRPVSCLCSIVAPHLCQKLFGSSQLGQRLQRVCVRAMLPLPFLHHSIGEHAEERQPALSTGA